MHQVQAAGLSGQACFRSPLGERAIAIIVEERN
jgi:hypothetical protein